MTGDSTTKSRARDGDRRVSIQTVADAAGVSIATVSRVLNTPSIVAESTAARVLETVRELGYRPNLFAKGLMTRRSRVLGVSLPEWSGDSYAELMRGADQRARELGYHLLVTTNSHRPSDEGLPPAFALDLIDGMVAMVTSRAPQDIETLLQLNMPVVVLTSAIDGVGDDVVELDNYVGAHAASLHLADGTDAASCYFVGGPSENRDAARRAAAFRDALLERGHSVRPEQINHGAWSFQWGWTWASRLLEAGDLRGAAVLAGNDEIAVGIGHRAKEAGLVVGRDIRLVGFDDARVCPFLSPPLSSVRVPNRRIGVEAVSLVVRRIENPDVEPMRVRVPTSVVIRESSQY